MPTSKGETSSTLSKSQKQQTRALQHLPKVFKTFWSPINHSSKPEVGQLFALRRQDEWREHWKYFIMHKRVSEFPVSQKRSLPSSLGLKTLMFLLLFSHLVMSNSLWPHGLQQGRLLCPSPTPGACSNSCPSGQWCHPTISSSVIPFSSCLQSFPASGSFPMSHLFSLGGQNNGASASSSVLPINIQDWFPSGLTGLISLQSKGLSRVFFNTTGQKHQFLRAQPSLWSNTHIHTWLTGKTTALTRQTFDGKVMSLLFNTLSRFVTAFLPRSKHLLISWLQSPFAVTVEPRKIKSASASTVSPSIWHEVMGMGPDAMILVFWMLSLKPAFSLSLMLMLEGYFLLKKNFLKALLLSY